MFFPIVLTFGAQAAVINATSCSQIDVQAAINSAIDGDVVVVPSGNCTWTNTVSILNKAITIKGAGIDQTVITDSTPSGWEQNALLINNLSGKSITVTGFTFKGGTGSEGILQIKGGTKKFRIDHIKFDNPSTRCIQIFGYTYGVIDNCTWNVGQSSGIQGVSVIADGDDAWNRDLTLGTENAVYVENCTFNYSNLNDGALDAYGGARYVFRYNTVVGTSVGHHGRDSGGYRSTHSFEIYNNTFNNTGTAVFTSMNFRGGTGVVFGNTITGNYNNFMYVHNYRSCGSYAPAGICDGSSVYDGNESGKEGYPCQDQIGRTTGQTLSPLYEWNNTYKGGNGDIVVSNDCTRMTTLHIIQNRDFYNDTPKPGYIPYTYPHPLTLSSNPSETVPPAPPKNLRVQ